MLILSRDPKLIATAILAALGSLLAAGVLPRPWDVAAGAAMAFLSALAAVPAPAGGDHVAGDPDGS